MAQEQFGASSLEAIWLPALADGLRAGGHTDIADRLWPPDRPVDRRRRQAMNRRTVAQRRRLGVVLAFWYDRRVQPALQNGTLLVGRSPSMSDTRSTTEPPRPHSMSRKRRRRSAARSCRTAPLSLTTRKTGRGMPRSNVHRS